MRLVGTIALLVLLTGTTAVSIVALPFFGDARGDDAIEGIEPLRPLLPVLLEPRRLFLETTRAEPACAHAPDLLGLDEPGLLEDGDVLLHTGEGHAERVGELGDRGIGLPEMLEHAAAGHVRQRGERGVEAGVLILHHMVQYQPTRPPRAPRAQRR